MSTPAARTEWYERFLYALRSGAIPAGRIVSNAGASSTNPQHRRLTAPSRIPSSTPWTISCKSPEQISRSKPAAALATNSPPCALKVRTSVVQALHLGPTVVHGYLRQNVFHRVFRWRRGARMGTFDIGHPDVMDFIRAKEDGRLVNSIYRC